MRTGAKDCVWQMKNASHPLFHWLKRTSWNGGEEEIRTLDPHVANVMLYQLSYFPISKKRRVLYQIPVRKARGYFKWINPTQEAQHDGG